jgi:ERCC4-related helicase
LSCHHGSSTLVIHRWPQSFVLILVKERGSAFEIEEILRSQVDLRTAERGVSALVGHGTTSGTDPGMKVSHQKGVLDNIREHKYNSIGKQEF